MALVSIGSVAFHFWEGFVRKLLLNFSDTHSVPPSEQGTLQMSLQIGND